MSAHSNFVRIRVPALGETQNLQSLSQAKHEEGGSPVKAEHSTKEQSETDAEMQTHSEISVDDAENDSGNVALSPEEEVSRDAIRGASGADTVELLCTSRGLLKKMAQKVFVGDMVRVTNIDWVMGQGYSFTLNVKPDSAIDYGDKIEHFRGMQISSPERTNSSLYSVLQLSFNFSMNCYPCSTEFHALSSYLVSSPYSTVHWILKKRMRSQTHIHGSGILIHSRFMAFKALLEALHKKNQ